MNANSGIPKKKKERSLHLGVDVPFLVCVLALLAIGLLMVYSAGWEYSMTTLGEKPDYLFNRQIQFVILGCLGAALIYSIDYHRFKKLLFPMMVAVVILLILVSFVYGETRLGARRSLFQGSIQPSEFAKLAVVIYLAFWLYAKQDVLDSVKFGLLPLAGILGLIAGLIMAQPDFSAVLTIVLMGGIMFFIGGGNIRQIIVVLLVVMVIGSALIFLYPTAHTRVSDFVAGLQDPQNASYQTQRSIEAIVKGGFWGVGIGHATTKFTGLPVAPTDSIYAVIVEELGLFGAAVVVLLFLFFLWRGLTIASQAPDLLGKLLAAGISIWIFVEAAINICVMVNIIPIAGNALPFISAGGSNMVTVLAGVGFILNVSRATANQKNKEEGRPIDEVVDLRRNDGWRSVPRSRRSSNAHQTSR
ncbi:MAG: FtsW/RodA/SpoVE family cell cycle protein [Pelolinea sp.]|jgi:cell division protein FtsW|nr:FtsW/RodA/SpoVE family cell cycle protein [Pelolinea sp.]